MQDLQHGVGQGAPLALRALLAEAQRALHDDPPAARRCLAHAVRLLDGPGDGVVSGGLAPWQAGKVQALIEARLADKLTTAMLAAAVRLSPGHFTRAFKKTFGEAPHAFAMRRRIARAKTLMLTTGVSLSEIALDCGLADQAHLSRVFRKFENDAPAAWRRRNHQG